MASSLPIISNAGDGGEPEDATNVYAKFATASERRKGLVDRFADNFGQPMRDNAAEHQIYMETTVADFKKKIEHLEKLLRSESARRTQIGVTFRAFFKDTMLEIQDYGTAQRAATNARISERFEDTKRRLEELANRLPVEEAAMLAHITEKTDEIRDKVDTFLAVDCANESIDCKARHQVLTDLVGTSTVLVEDQMQNAQKVRQTSMSELRDVLEQSSTLAAKNAHKLQASLQHELAGLKNSLTTENLLQELSDTQLAVAMQRQVSYVMQSAKAVNSTIGLDEVEPLDYATRETLIDRQKRLERKLREKLRREREEAQQAYDLENGTGGAKAGAGSGDGLDDTMAVTSEVDGGDEGGEVGSNPPSPRAAESEESGVSATGE